MHGYDVHGTLYQFVKFMAPGSGVQALGQGKHGHILEVKMYWILGNSLLPFIYKIRTRETWWLSHRDTVVAHLFVIFSNPDWWYAKRTQSGEGRNEGYVPSNYVAKDDTLETYEWVNFLVLIWKCLYCFFLTI